MTRSPEPRNRSVISGASPQPSDMITTGAGMTSRREFMKAMAIGSAGLTVGWNARSYARIVGANERVSFAVIGLHGRGYAHLDSICAAKGALLSYVCDVDRNELDKFADQARTK